MNASPLRRHRGRSLAMALALSAPLAVSARSARAAEPLPDPAPGAAFVAVEPCRLFDSRELGERVDGGDSHKVAVAGECDVPSAAVAAALTVTVVGPEAPGYALLYPSGGEPPTASTVNYRSGQVVANLQLTRLADGDVDVFTLATAHIVVDVNGYFAPVGNGPGRVGDGSGRYVAVGPERVVDTRTAGKPKPGGTVRVATEAAGVPDDATAVAVNVTTADTNGPDFFTAYAAGTSRPTASVLNVDRARQARAAAVITPVDDGEFEVYTEAGNHVIVDVLGYFTGTTDEPSDSGLFVPVDPVRLADTRRPAAPDGGPRLWDRGSREFAVPDELDAPAGLVGSLALNVTVTATEDAGYVALGAAGAPLGSTSSVNYSSAQQTVANAAIAAVSERGLQTFAESSTHVVIDVTGWFTGAPGEALGEPPANPLPPERRVTIIGDSVLAGIRWNAASGSLRGFEPVDETESCRRLVSRSCFGREGYRPATALATINALPSPGPEEILVIGLGYDDWHAGFAGDFDAIVAAARARGFHHIAWLTLRTNVPYHYTGFDGPTNYAVMNTVLRSKLDTGDFPEVRLWDFSGYTAGVPGWFTSDGVHLRPLGAWGVGDWLSRHVAAFDERPCPMPWASAQDVADPCPDPDPLPPAQGWPDVAALYGR